VGVAFMLISLLRMIRCIHLTIRSSPPEQIPSARAPNTSDVRTTLSVCVESAIRAATAVLGTPPALSTSTALRKYQSGDTEDGRDNECSKHDFISV
jgi:hypothetical protein